MSKLSPIMRIEMALINEKTRNAYAAFLQRNPDARVVEMSYFDGETWGALYVDAERQGEPVMRHQVLVFGDKTEYDFYNLSRRG